MELKVEKERVLEAAKFGPKSESLLRILFPEAFEKDVLAIKEGVFVDPYDQDLETFCRKAFNDEDALRIGYGAPTNLNPPQEKLVGRSLYVSAKYDVELLKVHMATIIVFKNKT